MCCIQRTQHLTKLLYYILYNYVIIIHTYIYIYPQTVLPNTAIIISSSTISPLSRTFFPYLLGFLMLQDPLPYTNLICFVLFLVINLILVFALVQDFDFQKNQTCLLLSITVVSFTVCLFFFFLFCWWVELEFRIFVDYGSWSELWDYFYTCLNSSD